MPTILYNIIHEETNVLLNNVPIQQSKSASSGAAAQSPVLAITTPAQDVHSGLTVSLLSGDRNVCISDSLILTVCSVGDIK